MYPIYQIFVSEKSVDKSGCDKSEDALYYLYLIMGQDSKLKENYFLLILIIFDGFFRS